ncbi:MAG: hypothetical protein AAF692_09230 [Pseudomonadota bacterium]
MQAKAISAVILLGASLGACTTSPDFHTTRSVFHNPYAALEVDVGPVGPQCEESVITRDGCYFGGPVLARRGRWALDNDGRLVRLTRAQRNFERQREDALEAKADLLESLETGTPLPSGSPAIPGQKR